MNCEEICLKDCLCIYLYIFIYLLMCVINVLLWQFFSPSSVCLRPWGNLGLPEAQMSGGLVFAGWVVLRTGSGPLLRLALLYFDSLGFDGSGACWLGLSCGGEGLLELAGHPPRGRLSLTHWLAHFSNGFILHDKKKLLGPPAQAQNLIIHYFDW